MSLIYSMLMSLDGYVEDERWRFGWGAPEDEELHSYINQLASSAGTYLCGRRMYETMVYCETAHAVPNQPQFVLEWARQWQAAEKIVYSRTLAEPCSVRTRIEREFDPDVVRRLKGDARHDITVNGPGLAAQALRVGLADEPIRRKLRSSEPENSLGALSNSGPAVRRYSEGRAPAHQIKQNQTGLPRNSVMRSVNVLEFVSLDGVIQAPGGPEEDNTKPPLWKSVVPAVLFIVVAISLLLASGTFAQQASQTSKFIRENSPVIALTHVQLIDGTGAATQTDQTIVIDHGKIAAVGSAASTSLPAGAKVIDAKGKTVIPGLVGMHEHLFYPAANDGEPIFIEQPFSFPQLYLASGVTTARTTGSIEPYTDLQVKARVDGGRLPGPDLYLTTPYLEGAPSAFLQLHPLKDAVEARGFVEYWHSVGFTSVKAYMDVKPDELRAGIEEAHKLGMKVTGHLCSLGYIEAAEMGIDDLEHGPYGAPDGELYSKKKPGVCLDDFSGYFAMLAEIIKNTDPDGPELRKTIDALVAHHVAVTSTLAVFEGAARPPMNSGIMKRSHELMSPQAWSKVMTLRANMLDLDPLIRTWLQKEMKFERSFVAAGGMLLAGCDPTGTGQTLAGLGDQRQVELLVEGGFTPVEAIHIATQNGATFLGAADRIGSVAPGKQADLVLLDGDLNKDITVIEKPEIVFKSGVGYDSNAIYESLHGQIGLQ